MKATVSEPIWHDDYRPLRVVAHLRSPIAMLPDEALPLDGILEYAAFTVGRRRQANAIGGKRQRERCAWPAVLQYRDPVDPSRWLPTITNEPLNFALPVKRWGHRANPDWYWCASWAFFPDGFELDRAHWNRRADFADPEMGEHVNFGGRTERISISSGRYKSYHMPMCLVVAPRVEWYCFGALDGVTMLLREITNLGHKRGAGWGEIARWEILAMRDDWSCWRGDAPARALPDEPGEYRRGYAPIRSPAWHPSRKRLCILPPARVPGLTTARTARSTAPFPS